METMSSTNVLKITLDNTAAVRHPRLLRGNYMGMKIPWILPLA